MAGWRETRIGHLKADLFEPVERNPVAGAVLFLHGYDEVTLRDNPAWTTALNAAGLPCVCPRGGKCWWLDELYEPFDSLVTPLSFLRTTLASWIETTWNVPRQRIGVTGVEMGGQGALQLSYRAAREFPVVAAISPKVDFENWWGHGLSLDDIFPSREAARQRTATLHIHPLDWPRQQLLLCDPADQYCIDGVEILASKLNSSGIPFECDVTSTHGGFGWNYANAMAENVVQFLANSIEKESRRLTA